jgi:hypothetical protein
MAEVTGSIGNEQVELNNAATESTLRALLAAMNKQTASIVNLGNKLGGGAGGGAGGQAQAAQQVTQATNQQTKATKDETTATNEATASMSKMAKGAMILGGIIGDLAGSAFKTVGNLTDFAGQLMDGQGSVSGFYKSLKDLPLGMGLVAGLFAKIAEMQEEELKAYRDLSKAGVNFGGSLNTVRQNALDLGLTMDQYTGVIKKNQDAMALLGGNTNKGAIVFQRMAKELRDSQLGEQLRGMGVDSESAANGLASYVKMTGARNAEELKNTKAIAESAGQYMKNLDALSQLTGESKEALEQKMQEEAQEAQFQAYLTTLDEEGRKKALAGLQESLARGGKGAAQAFKDQVQGLPPMTEAGQQFVAQSQAGAKAVDTFAKNVKDSTKTVEDQKKAGDKLTFGLSQEAKAMGNTNAAIARAGGAASDVTNVQAKALSQMAAAGAKTEEDVTNSRKKTEAQQDALAKSAAARAAESEKAMKDMGAAIYGALQPAIAELTPIINKLAQEFMGFVKDNMPAIKEALTKFIHFVEDFVKNLFSDAGREKIVNDAIYYLKLMWISIKEGLPSILGGGKENADKEREALKQEKEGYDKRAEAARTQMDNQRALNALELARHEDKRKAVEKDIADTTKEVTALEEKAKTEKGLDEKEKKELADKKAHLESQKQLRADASDQSLVNKGFEAEKAIKQQNADAGKADQNAKDTRMGKPNAPATQEDLAAAGMMGAAKGGVFKGPESGFPIMLHGNEAVVPLENMNNVGKTVLPDFMSKLANLPALTEAGQNITPQSKAGQAAQLDKPKGMFDDMMEKLGGAGQGLSSALTGPGNNEMLLKEIQTLNKQTADLVKYMKATLDENKTQTSKLGSLTGNLYV